MASGSSAQGGFSYLFVLMLIATIGLGLAMAGGLWQTDARRAREADLLFIGDQYRQAIRSYYELDPGQPKLPQTLDDLTGDNRRPTPVRHLRRAYRDPMTGGEFVLIRARETQGIFGVHSSASGVPLKTAGFAAEYDTFADATSYSEWRFVFTPATTAAPEPNVAPAAKPEPVTGPERAPE
ncbi:type II secretion system protein [Thiobacillus sp.]